MGNFQGFPLLNTKLTLPPVRAGMVHRPRLVARLNEGLQCGFILVSAPPGYGKTTLLAEWAAQSPYPVAWLSLDVMDNDLFLFSRYITKALQTIFPDLIDSMIALPQEAGIRDSFIPALTLLINEIEKRSSHFILALDDYHVIENETIHAAFRFLLDHLPPKLHLLISSRTDPPLDISRLRARNRMEELHLTDLNFNAAEMREFLSETMKLRLSAEQMVFLEQRTEGWITGLQLAALSLRGQTDPGRLIVTFSGDDAMVLEYMVEEVFKQQSTETQKFLLQTSILDTLNSSLCEAVTGLPANSINGQTLLHKLYHLNMFITALDLEEHNFRYHPLFAEALYHLLGESMADEIPNLHKRACAWYEEHGDIENALKHAFEAQDHSHAAEIITRNFDVIVNKGGVRSILKWLRKFPEEMVKKHPALCLSYAWGLAILFEIDSAEEWIEQALKVLPQDERLAEGISSDFIGEIYAIRSIIAFTRGEGEKAIELSEKALENLPQDSLFVRSYVILEQGIYYLLNGETCLARKVFEEAIHICQATGNWMVMMTARSELGETLALQGQLTKAMTVFLQSIQISVDPDGKPLGFVGNLYIEMGEVFLARNELTEAMHYINRGIEVCRNWLPMLFELDGRLNLAHLKQCLGDINGALAELALARQIVEVSEADLDNQMMEIFSAKMALLRGDLRTALIWAQKNNYLETEFSPCVASFPYLIYVYVQMNVARIWLALGRQDKENRYLTRAYAILQNLLPRLMELECIEIVIEVLILQALTLQEMDKMDEALNIVQQAYALSEPEGFRRVFLDEGLPMARLTARLLNRQKRGSLLPAELPTRGFLSEVLRLFSGASGDMVDVELPERNALAAASAGAPDSFDLLTTREIEVLRLVAGGASNADIARELFLAVNTVKRHLNNIFLKLGATTRTQAVSIARQIGLIE